MDAPFFEKIFDLNAVAFAYLDAGLKVVSGNTVFHKYTDSQKSAGNSTVVDLLPELVGLEGILEEVAAGKRFSFQLPNINRENGDELTRYFDFSMYSTGDSSRPILFLIEDRTREASLSQQILQQDNEIRLLEGLLANRGDNLSARIWGHSRPIELLRHQIEKLSKIPMTALLLEGESGTGKSMVARVLHDLSLSARAPFIEINCAAIPETLLESELFGYEKGAFTNAVTGKKGLLEEADGGTLFLDEIGELPFKLQAKLLSFLETRRFRSLGSNSEKEVRTRLIAATNRDLGAMVQEKSFREDLYYRLNVVRVQLPPLRDMGDDVLFIAQNFLRLLNADFKKNIRGFDSDAANKMLNHHWPGNIRELRNAIERALIFVENDRISENDLQIGALNREEPSSSPLDRFQLPEEGLSFSEIEKKLLEDALGLSNGNQSKAAQLLRLSRDAFRYRLEKHDLL